MSRTPSLLTSPRATDVGRTLAVIGAAKRRRVHQSFSPALIVWPGRRFKGVDVRIARRAPADDGQLVAAADAIELPSMGWADAGSSLGRCW